MQMQIERSSLPCTLNIRVGENETLILRLIASAKTEETEYGIFSSGGQEQSDIYIYRITRTAEDIQSVHNVEDEKERQSVFDSFIEFLGDHDHNA